LVGEISLGINAGGREDVISVLLHFAEGSLSLLEVIWYNFPEPIPATWVETSSQISVGRSGAATPVTAKHDAFKKGLNPSSGALK